MSETESELPANEDAVLSDLTNKQLGLFFFFQSTVMDYFVYVPDSLKSIFQSCIKY